MRCQNQSLRDARTPGALGGLVGTVPTVEWVNFDGKKRETINIYQPKSGDLCMYIYNIIYTRIYIYIYVYVVFLKMMR